MKKKFICAALILTLSLTSLSSCIFLSENGIFGSSALSDTINNISVQGGPNYENINITSTENKNLLAASKALLSSVSIITSSAAGSGVIYEIDKEKGNAYVITNYHVVYDQNNFQIAREINLFLYGMEASVYRIPATFVGGSMNYDIAVLYVENSTVLMESNARATDVANSDEVSILDTAIAVGNPEGSGISATVGCVNVDSETITVAFTTNKGESKDVDLRVMRTDAAVNSGNSGGGLFNDRGELIGIVNAKSGDTSSDNIGYAIPSNVAIAVAKNIQHYCAGTYNTSVYRCIMGVVVGAVELSTEYDIETGKITKNETVALIEVERGGAAYGLLEVNDVINYIMIDGVKYEVTRTHNVVDCMLNARVGSAVVFNVTRDGEAVDVTIPMTENMLKAY